MAKLMNIGFGNMVNTDKIVSIISSDSAPAKRMISRGKEQEILIDATQGRRTKSVIFTENNKIILSALQPETLAGRFNGKAPIEEAPWNRLYFPAFPVLEKEPL